MTEEELKQLEEEVADEVENAFVGLVYGDGPLNKVLPPTSITKLAAEAAAKVFIAFERGYQMPNYS